MSPPSAEELARTLPLERLEGLSPGKLREGITLPRLDVAMTTQETQGADIELVRTLGRGGMGLVWLARRRSLAREVAIKRLHPETWSSSGAAALLAEACATGALEHPSIVAVHALGLDESGSPLLVMKRIEGASVGALVRDPAHVAWPELERRHGDRTTAIVEILMRVLAGGAIGFDPRLGWSAAAFGIGGLVSALWPSLGVVAMGAAAISAAIVVLRDSLDHVREDR